MTRTKIIKVSFFLTEISYVFISEKSDAKEEEDSVPPLVRRDSDGGTTEVTTPESGGNIAKKMSWKAVQKKITPTAKLSVGAKKKDGWEVEQRLKSNFYIDDGMTLPKK